jgi:hypothetical protein
MPSTLTRWIQLRFIDSVIAQMHECELCGDLDTTHEALSTGETVCWHCAERTGEYQVPGEMEWRVPETP